MRRERIYIVPTGRGLAFLSLVVVQILCAATYNNNLIFIVGFFLFALFVVSMLETHDNLRGLELHFVGSEGAFTGAPIAIGFRVAHRRARDQRALVVRPRGTLVETVTPGLVDLPADQPSASLAVMVRLPRRGVFALGDVILETRHPHGLFRAWRIVPTAAEIFAYPKPDPAAPILAPRAGASGGDGLATSIASDGDLGDLRPLVKGESYHRVAWKQYARSGQLVAKTFAGAERAHYVLPWPGGDEASLSALSAWIERARVEGASFEIPARELGPDAGDSFAHACWRALAREGQ